MKGCSAPGRSHLVSVPPQRLRLLFALGKRGGALARRSCYRELSKPSRSTQGTEGVGHVRIHQGRSSWAPSLLQVVCHGVSGEGGLRRQQGAQFFSGDQSRLARMSLEETLNYGAQLADIARPGVGEE